MNLVEFTDRVSTHPQRKKLKIVSQSANDMIVDVEAFDSPTVVGAAITDIVSYGLTHHQAIQFMETVQQYNQTLLL